MRKALLILAVWVLAACSSKPTRGVPTPVMTSTQARTASPIRQEMLEPSLTHPSAGQVTASQSAGEVPPSLASGPTRTPLQPTRRVTPSSTFLPTTPAHPPTIRPLATPTRRATTLVPLPSATIDLSRQVTRTSVASPVCPPVTPGLTPDFSLPKGMYDPTNDFINQVLAYLNSGGSLESVSTWLENATAEYTFQPTSLIQDVNGDHTPDLVMDLPRLWVASCHDGQYVALYNNPEAPELERILEVSDVNRDSVAEITFYDLDLAHWSALFRMFEWNGEDFADLFRYGIDDPAWLTSTPGRFLTWYDPYPDMGAFQVGGVIQNVYFQDKDGDGFQEFYLDKGTPNLFDVRLMGPWRPTHETYSWDGRNYTLYGLEIDPPQYRFQAIQDGDRLSFVGRYAEALALYQAAIFSNGLAAWSWSNYRARVESGGNGTPTPTIIPHDTEEYGHLAAYARFRIMLLHLAQGHISDAQVVYDTLQAKFPAGAPGHLYAQTAEAFWEKYQASLSLSQACQVVIQAAAADPAEFFRYLGYPKAKEGDHGAQSHGYIPEDTCPFR